MRLELNVMWIILVHASEAFTMIRDHPKVTEGLVQQRKTTAGETSMYSVQEESRTTAARALP